MTGYGREQARRRRRPDEPEPHREEAERRARPEPERLLELQRSAGNHAVSALVARQPAKPGDKKDTGATVTLPKIGTIAAESVQFPSATSPGGRGSEDKQPAQREIVVSSFQGAHSAALFRAMLDGTPLREVVIAMPGGVRMILRDAMIGNYTVAEGGGEPLETWTLDFRSIEFGKEGDKPKQGAEGAGRGRDREPG